jgi:ABC-type multidrug transport system fused ATPase/permease subunit
VLEKGRAVESGLHEELYDKKGTYYDIFTAMANSLNLDKITKTMED